MTRVPPILFQLFAFLAVYNSALAASLTESDLVGTYRLDPASLHRQTVPTNFFAFALTLNADGSFVATNVPADFFFSYTPTPAAPEARGKWALKHIKEKGSFFCTGENDYLQLSFSAPTRGFMSTLVEGWSPRIQMSYHSGKSDAAAFYLKKQR